MGEKTGMLSIINYSNGFATGVGAVLEALVLFWFCGPLPFRWKGKALNICLHIITAGLFVLLHYQYYQFLVQCPLLILLVLCYICFVRKTNFKNVLVLDVVFCVVGEVSHLLAENIIRDWFLGDFLRIGAGSRESYFTLILYAAVFMVLLLVLKGILYRNDRSRLRMREIMVPFLVFIPFFYLRYYQYTEVAAGVVDRKLYLILILMAAIGLILILSNEYFIYDHIDRSEMEKMRLMMEKQREYYQLQEESVRNVNRNYHDLKHILTVLKSEGTQGAEEYVERLQGEIAPFETVQRTGNSTLDILVSQKLRDCQEAGVRVTTCIDGRGLSFMNSLDLSVLFGNAMDNCLEAAGKVSDEVKREIYVKVGEWGGQVLMRFENFYEGPKPDLTTSKEDKSMHGYGLKNMEAVARRYHGVLTCETEGDRFLLTIMLPEVQEADCECAEGKAAGQ